jgi:hypothetical protein
MKIKRGQKPSFKHHLNECRVIFLGGGCSKLDIDWLDHRTFHICDSCGMILLQKWLSNFALLSSKLSLPVTLT